MKRTFVTVLSCAALVGSMMLAAAPASASDRPGSPQIRPGTSETMAEGLLTPLSLEVDRHGGAYVSQDFAGLLTRVARDGTATTVATAEGKSIGAISSRRGTVYFAQTAPDHSSSILMAVRDGEEPTMVADLQAHEESMNPDRVNTYGFAGLPQACADQFDGSNSSAAPPTYSGSIDTNPYASLALSHAVYVADAGANAILRVGYDGTVSTVAVLPPGDPVIATPGLLASLGFPKCAAGYEYRFEPVPTDVELGPDGWLYVTSLSGGPEDPRVGAAGSVFKVNPHNGNVVQVATGFAGATGLAVSMRSGSIAVAELFGGPDGSGQISVLTLSRDATRRTTYTDVTHPAAIELRRNKLYVTTDAFVPDPVTGVPQADGKLTVIPLEVDRGQLEDSSDNGS